MAKRREVRKRQVAQTERRRGAAQRGALRREARRSPKSKAYTKKTRRETAKRRDAKGRSDSGGGGGGGVLGTLGRAAGGSIGEALEALDVPGSVVRNAVAGGVKSIKDVVTGEGDGGDLLRALAMITPAGGLGAGGIGVQASDEDVRRDIKRHTGVGEHLERAGIDDVPVLSNDWSKRALGFTGDVALDPLSYLAPATKLSGGARAVSKRVLDEGAERTAGRLAREAGVSTADPRAMRAVTGEARRAVAEPATRVRAKGASSLSEQETRDLLGTAGGVQFRMPGTGRVARGVGLRKGPTLEATVIPKALTDPISRTVAAGARAPRGTRLGAILSEHFSGANPEILAAARSGDPERAVPAMRFESAERTTRQGAEHLGQRKLDEYAGLRRGFRGHEDDLVDALEGSEDAARRLATAGVDPEPMRRFLSGLYDEAEAAGIPIQELDSYFPRMLRAEARDVVTKSGKNAGRGYDPTKGRSLTAEKMGLDDTASQSAVREEVERFARDELGLPDGFYEKNPDKVLPVYIQAISRRIGRQNLINRLQGDDIVRRELEPVEEALKGATKKGGALGRQIARAEEDAARLGDEAGAQRSAASTLDESTTELGSSPSSVVLSVTPSATDTMRLVRHDAAGVDLIPEHRPHGTYYTIVGNGSPHVDVGSIQYDALARPDRPLSPPEIKVVVPGRFRGGAIDASAGVAALHHLVGADEFQRLAHLSKTELASELKRMFPGSDYSRYYDTYELLEAYGAQLARRHGHDAIVLPDKLLPEFSEYVALKSSALKTDTSAQAGKTSVDLVRAVKAELQQALKRGGFKPAGRGVFKMTDLSTAAEGSIAAELRASAEASATDVERILADASAVGLRGSIERRGDDIVVDLTEGFKPQQVPVPAAARSDAAVELTLDAASARSVRIADNADELEAAAAQTESLLEGVRAGMLNGDARLVEREELLESSAGLLRAAQAEQDPVLRRVAVLEAKANEAEAAALEVSGQADKLQAKLGALKTTRMVKRQIQEVKDGAYEMLAREADPDGAGLAAPKDIADALNRVDKVLTPEGMRGFVNHYDQLVNFIKGWQVTSPGFHARNAYGGAFNNYINDIDMGAYRRYRRVKAAVEKGEGTRQVTRLGVKAKATPAEMEAYRQLRDVVSRGQYSTQEIASGLSHERLLTRLNPMSSGNVLVRGSMRAGGGVEELLRGALGMDVMLKGGSLDDATESIAKYHFDYGDLSGPGVGMLNEQNLKRRVIPFYTWTRKNLPLQIEMMALRPGKYSKYYQAKLEVEQGTPEEGLVPQYFEDLLGIRTPMSYGGGQIYAMPDLPFTRSITETLPFDPEGFDPTKPLGMTTPVVKTPIERLMGHQFFKDIPFSDKYAEAPAAWQRVPGLMEALSVIGEAKKVNGEWQMQDRAAYTVEQYLPMLGRMRRQAPSEKKFQDRALTTWLSFFGAPLRTNTKTEQRLEKFRRSLDAGRTEKVFVKKGRKAVTVSNETLRRWGENR